MGGHGITTPDVVGVIVHAADLHLGAPLESLGRHTDPDQVERWRQLAAVALDQLVDLALERRADALVIAGDVYDGADREVSAQLRFARALERLTDQGIRVFIAHGNHDPVTANFHPAVALPDGVTVFEPGDVQVHELETKSGEVLHIAGLSFSTQHERENLASRFTRLDVRADRCVAVLHANLESTSGHDPYAPCSIADLERAPVAYWALGHVHQRSLGSLGPGRWWAYSGNLQGRSAKATECGPKGAFVVTIAAHGVAEPEFVSCDGLRFARVDVDVTDARDLGETFDILAGASRQVLDDASPRPVLIRARLIGATPAHSLLSAEREHIDGLAREHIGARIAPGGFVHIEVATRPAVDRDRLIAREDLLSALLRRLDEIHASDTALAPHAADALDARTRRLLDEFEADPDHRAEILGRVEQILIDRLAAS